MLIKNITQGDDDNSLDSKTPKLKKTLLYKVAYFDVIMGPVIKSDYGYDLGR